jgi:hypothetical protein
LLKLFLMIYQYCTLFDSLYLSRALVMYESLVQHCQNFHLYIFPFDEKSEKILNDLNLKNVSIISLRSFEDEDLLAVKKSRTKGEYCWTCTPATISYCIKTFKLDHCTYIDADLYFFGNPNVLIDEMGDNSVLITEHRYSEKYDQALKRGIYCVQFITFKNTSAGLEALNWWRDKCIEWCYSRLEEGKFGDQKYLDDWTVRFKEVHVLEHLGGGVAPWNIQQFTLSDKDGKTYIHSKQKSAELIFYHFHYVKFYKNDRVDLGNYILTNGMKRIIYQKYIDHIIEVEKMLMEKFKFDRVVQDYFYKINFLKPIHRIARKLMGIYNVENVSDLRNGSLN